MKKEIKKLFKNKYFYLSLFILIFGIMINLVSSIALFKEEESFPVISDLILDSIPLIKFAYIYNIFSYIVIVMLLAYIFKKNKYNELPYFMTLFGILYAIRGIFIILTPFGNPVEEYNILMEKLRMFRFGVYPSGHTGTAFLIFFFTDGIYKYIVGICCLFIVVLLLLAKNHYSIDLFSAVIFAYAIWCFGEKHLTKLKE